jgi:hypothetical protein
MSQKTQEYAQQMLSRMVYPDMPLEDGLRLVQSNLARSGEGQQEQEQMPRYVQDSAQKQMRMFAEGGQVELPIYDVKGNRTVINYDGGGGDSYVDPNPGWSGLSQSQQASYFADPKNAFEGDLRGLAQKGFSNYTTLGLLQNYFVPDFVRDQMSITAGIDPVTGLQGQGDRGQTGLHGDKGVGFNPDGSVKGYDPSIYDSPTSYDTSNQTGAPGGVGLGTGDGGMGSGGGRSAGDSDGTTGGGGLSASDAANGPGDGTSADFARGGIVRRAEGSPEQGEISDEDFVRMQNTARKGDAYRELEKYLQSRDAMPSIKVAYLPEGTDGVFSSDNLNIGSGTLKISKNAPKATVPSVLAHEMTHAADRQMKQQAIEQGMYGKNNQFTEAYEKLVGPEGRNRTQLLRRLNPEYASENRLYRADPKEVAAYGIGAFSGPSLQDRGPRHVDATAATEFRILMDLAQRNVDEGPKGLAKIPAFFRKMARYTDGGPVERRTDDDRRYL